MILMAEIALNRKHASLRTKLCRLHQPAPHWKSSQHTSAVSKATQGSINTDEDEESINSEFSEPRKGLPDLGRDRY